MIAVLEAIFMVVGILVVAALLGLVVGCACGLIEFTWDVVEREREK